MSKVITRIDDLINRGQGMETALAIVATEQLERIADALEKQNAGNQMVKFDGRGFGKLADD